MASVMLCVMEKIILVILLFHVVTFRITEYNSKIKKLNKMFNMIW